jgi:hypothetical protein
MGRICKYTANLRRNIPRKKKEDEDVEENARIHIESRERVSLRIVCLSLNRTHIFSLLSIAMSKFILFRMMASVELVALRVCVWDRRPLGCCPFRIDLIRPTFLRMRTGVNVLVVMFSRQM